MEQRTFVPGRLRLKSKKPKSAAAKEAAKEAAKPSAARAAPAARRSTDTILDSLTIAEAKFLSVNNQYTRRVVEERASVSYQEQKEHFNEALRRAPMHHDLEGE
jgi:hypothetical protein